MFLYIILVQNSKMILFNGSSIRSITRFKCPGGRRARSLVHLVLRVRSKFKTHRVNVFPVPFWWQEITWNNEIFLYNFRFCDQNCVYWLCVLWSNLWQFWWAEHRTWKPPQCLWLPSNSKKSKGKIQNLQKHSCLTFKLISECIDFNIQRNFRKTEQQIWKN